MKQQRLNFKGTLPALGPSLVDLEGNDWIQSYPTESERQYMRATWNATAHTAMATDPFKEAVRRARAGDPVVCGLLMWIHAASYSAH
jgi:hypothetical protein